jgi:hypothetical protein
MLKHPTTHFKDVLYEFKMKPLNNKYRHSRLSGVMEGRKVTDNTKPWLKQKQSKHGTKWI